MTRLLSLLLLLPSLAIGETVVGPRMIRTDEANVIAFGAVPDDGLSDTAAVQSAIDYVKTHGGGTVFFPQGSFNVNVSVVGTNVHLRGAGSMTSTNLGAFGATILTPASLASPVLTIGDGTTWTSGCSVSDLTIKGDLAHTAGSDGLKIVGAEFCHFRNLMLYEFGRDNLIIDTGTARPSQYHFFYGVETIYARGSCFHVRQSEKDGDSWVGAIYVYGLNGRGYSSAGCTFLHMEGTSALTVFGGWWQLYGNKLGHVKLESTAVGTTGLKLYGVNVETSNDASATATAFELAATSATHTNESWTYFLSGSFTCNASLEWPNGDKVNLTRAEDRLPWPHLREPRVIKGLSFNDATAATVDETEVYLVTQPVKLQREGATGSDTERLRLYGAGLTVRGTWKHPIGFRHPDGNFATGALWTNDTTNQLMWTNTEDTPDSDTDGTPIARMVAVPSTATSACQPGDHAASATFVYVCIAANSWVRSAAAAW